MKLSDSEKQYMLTLETEKKRAEIQLSNLEEQKQQWTERLSLAEQHAREDLISAAQGRLTEIETGISSLKSDIAVRVGEIEKQRSTVRDSLIDDGRILSRAQTQALVDQLETIAGLKTDDPLEQQKNQINEARKTEREIADIEADMELQSLKEKLNKDGQELPHIN